MSYKERLFESFAREDLIRLYKTASHPREKTRFLALSLMQQGKNPREVADLIHVKRNAIYVWARKFINEGSEALREKPGRGKKPLILELEREAFRQSVLDLQSQRKGGTITGRDVLHLMEEKYGVKCTLRSAYNHLKKASLVWISARSKHPKADLEAQESFKRTLRKI